MRTHPPSEVTATRRTPREPPDPANSRPIPPRQADRSSCLRAPGANRLKVEADAPAPVAKPPTALRPTRKPATTSRPAIDRFLSPEQSERAAMSPISTPSAKPRVGAASARRSRSPRRLRSCCSRRSSWRRRCRTRPTPDTTTARPQLNPTSRSLIPNPESRAQAYGDDMGFRRPEPPRDGARRAGVQQMQGSASASSTAVALRRRRRLPFHRAQSRRQLRPSTRNRRRNRL